MALSPAYLAPLYKGRQDWYFQFDFGLNRNQGGITRLAPHTNRRVYAANYVPVPLALSGHTPREWKSNNPVELNIEFEIVGYGQTAIETELRSLRQMMRKDSRTGEPPDLLFAMGSKQWVVRINRMEVNPVLWTEAVDEQRVKVQLFMHTVNPED